MTRKANARAKARETAEGSKEKVDTTCTLLECLSKKSNPMYKGMANAKGRDKGSGKKPDGTYWE